jgi:hypothetical protein
MSLQALIRQKYNSFTCSAKIGALPAAHKQLWYTHISPGTLKARR